jgi:hypothetical protein
VRGGRLLRDLQQQGAAHRQAGPLRPALRGSRSAPLSRIAPQVRLGKPHFRTVHARVGLAALLLGLAAPAAGALAFKALGLLARAPEPVQLRVKWAHRKARGPRRAARRPRRAPSGPDAAGA